MLPRADLAGARPVASPEATRPTILTGDARQEVFQRLERIALGTFFRAEVLSHLKDGSFMVKVADAAVRMNLPAGTQIGETLDLTLTAKQPRLTFLLNAPPAENTTSLSNAGRLIDRILHAAQNEGAPKVIVGKTPLTSSSSIEPEQLAGAMKNAVAFSGLFYESHVEQWANGHRPLMALMYEPQAKNSNLELVSAALRATVANTNDSASGAAAPGADAPDATMQQLTRLIESLQGKPEAARMLMDLLQAAVQKDGKPLSSANAMPQPSTATNTPPAQVASAVMPNVAETPENGLASSASAAMVPTDTRGTANPETMSSDSIRMINLQLNTLEQQRVVWQGELWPGQPIEWEVSEDTPHGREGEAEERVWQSVVRFQMPTLGTVSATVRLVGERVQIQVRTANEDTAALLRMHGSALSSALDAAGSPLEHLAVKTDDAP
ncbi:MAG TPA: flagellar hook-length control protein FliK [Noviherbaspirillum sp.]|nr:flagellar hook-length control protein FliK [Noviherbaspirillum sp.]